MPIKTTITYLSIVMMTTVMSLDVMSQGVHIEYGEDTLSSMGKYDRIYQVVLEQKVDANTLIKFDGVQWGQIQPSLTIEQRLFRDLTLEPNLTMSSLGWSSDGGLDFALNPNMDLKYYFNRPHRERLGKSVIGFSADYFSVGFSYTLTDDNVFYAYQLGERHIDFSGNMDALDKSYYSYFSWRVMYGIQRKIGNLAYVDVAFGAEQFDFNEFGRSKFIGVFKVKLGFALSCEQFKRFSR